MKQNRIEPNHGHGLAVTAVSVFAIVLIAGVSLGYARLRDIWLEQCVIRNLAEQVSVTDGKMVRADTLAERLGLVKGANIAHIDFAKKREEVLRDIPNLRSVSITRTMPDKVTVVTEERSPIAQLKFRGRKAPTGKVVDSDGMVFIHQNGTGLLPVIREAQAPGTPHGHLLTGRARAALQVIEACRDAEFQSLGVRDIDISKQDYLLATLDNYAQVKLAWDGMGEPSAKSRKNLTRQLSLLTKAIRSRVGDGTAVWNATDTTKPGRIYADGKGTL